MCSSPVHLSCQFNFQIQPRTLRRMKKNFPPLCCQPMRTGKSLSGLMKKWEGLGINIIFTVFTIFIYLVRKWSVGNPERVRNKKHERRQTHTTRQCLEKYPFHLFVFRRTYFWHSSPSPNEWVCSRNSFTWCQALFASGLCDLYISSSTSQEVLK